MNVPYQKAEMFIVQIWRFHDRQYCVSTVWL